jgi:GTP1/Obg family GTP-binding protein
MKLKQIQGSSSAALYLLIQPRVRYHKLDKQASLYKGIKPLVEAYKVHVLSTSSLSEVDKLESTNSFFL